jgi:8-oxo-dGTP pyrophosphatase MutT (NUDIX family)
MASDLSIFIDGIRLNVRVGVVLRHKDDVVLEFSNTAKHVVVPGGRMKIGEPSADALAREIAEEMGFDLDKSKLKFLKCLENFYDYQDYKNHEIYFIFSYELSSEELEQVLKLEKNKDNEDSYFKVVSRHSVEELYILPTSLVELLK